MTNFELFSDIKRVYDYTRLNKTEFLITHKEVTEEDYKQMQDYVRNCYGGLIDYSYYSHLFNLMKQKHEIALRCAIDSLNDESEASCFYGQIDDIGLYRRILKSVPPSYVINWAGKNLGFYFARDEQMNYKDLLDLAKKLLFDYILPQYEDAEANACWERLVDDGIDEESLKELGLYKVEMLDDEE